MPAEVAIWGRIVEPGKKITIEPPVNLLISGAALGAKLNDPKGRTVVQLTYPDFENQDSDDEEDEDDENEVSASIVLCSLTPEKIEQSTLNITIPAEQKVQLEVIGKNAIHLSGNWIDNDEDLSPSEDDFDSDEEGYALDEVSSDVEMDPALLDDAELDEDEEDDSERFEEIVDEKPEVATLPSKKRARESDAEAPKSETLSKKEQKKLAKKMKAENGEAAAPAVQAKADKKVEKEAEKAAKKEKEDKGDAAGEMKTTSSGLKTQDVKPGKGKAVKKGDLVQMRYIGKLQNGDVFDSNTKGKPFTFRLGAGEVIKGWDEGVVGMAVGGERLLVVPPKLAYGNQKMAGIPPNSTLRFECKLLGIGK